LDNTYGISLNILIDIFADKFPPREIPQTLKVLFTKAYDSLRKLSEYYISKDLEYTPEDFPMSWYYESIPFTDDNVSEIRALLEEIVDFASKVFHKEMYSNMQTTIEKISSNGSLGVKIIKEVFSSGRTKFSYVTEDGKQIYLPWKAEMKFGSYFLRPDTGQTLKVIGYNEIVLANNNDIVKALVKNSHRPDPIPGGVGADLEPEDVDPEQLLMGIEEEKEHSPDFNIRQDISLDHLKKDDEYYTKLKTIDTDSSLKFSSESVKASEDMNPDTERSRAEQENSKFNEPSKPIPTMTQTEEIPLTERQKASSMDRREFNRKIESGEIYEEYYEPFGDEGDNDDRFSSLKNSHIEKGEGGYYVTNKSRTKRLNKKPKSKGAAVKMLQAIEINKHKHAYLKNVDELTDSVVKISGLNTTRAQDWGVDNTMFVGGLLPLNNSQGRILKIARNTNDYTTSTFDVLLENGEVMSSMPGSFLKPLGIYVPIKSNADFAVDALVAEAIYKQSGTRNAPYTAETAKELVSYLNSLSGEVDVKEVEHEISNLIGDDDLFDSLDRLRERADASSIKNEVIHKINEWLSSTSVRKWKNQWDPTAITILQNFVNGNTSALKFADENEDEDEDFESDIPHSLVPDEEDMEELKNTIWHEIADSNNRWSGIEKALRKEEYGFSLDDSQIKDIKSYIDYRLEMTNMVANSSLRFSADVSDQVPPMGWNSEDNPSGAGPAKPPLDRLQQDPDADDPNVLYDSGKDTGGQFQTTINPKEKSVTVKFLDSPQKENLNNVVNQQQPNQLPQLNTKPQPPQNQQPSAPQGNPAPQFNEQNIPAEF
jgi:hypothetical protein